MQLTHSMQMGAQSKDLCILLFLITSTLNHCHPDGLRRSLGD